MLRSLLHGEVGLAQRGAQAARLQTLRPVMLGVIDRLESTAAGEVNYGGVLGWREGLVTLA